MSSGGTQVFALTTCPPLAGSTYILLGSAAGTDPGLHVGPIVIPLNPDPYFLFTLIHPGMPPLSDSMGILDAGGGALATLSIPPGTDASLAGLTLHHAYIVLGLTAPWPRTVSDPISVTFVP